MVSKYIYETINKIFKGKGVYMEKSSGLRMWFFIKVIIIDFKFGNKEENIL